MHNTLTSKDMLPVFGTKVELDPVAAGSELRVRTDDYITYQSKSNGIASEPTFSLNTFWNSSYVMVPESSLVTPTGMSSHNAEQYPPRMTHTSKYWNAIQ